MALRTKGGGAAHISKLYFSYVDFRVGPPYLIEGAHLVCCDMRPVRTKCDVEARLGRYELLEELGRGAMGIVYKARDPQIDRLVAIKTICNLAEDFEIEDTYRTRFMVEARAAGRLSHRGIVQVFDVAEEDSTRTPYIVMEYVPGISLSRMLAGNTKLPAESALRLAQEVAEALAYAHAHGVVHRDIKPSNIIVNDEGHAKVTDLGVAKVDFGNGTVGGQLVGTPAYMAPEQLNNSSEVDGRSDLFSLGIILYCVLSGYRPFQGNSMKTVAFKIRHHDPLPVTAFNLEVSPAIDYILARAMAKDPAERYQTGTEMALDLQDIRDNKRPRSWTDSASTDRRDQRRKGAEERYFHHVADIANISPLGAQVVKTERRSGVHWMASTVISTLNRNAGVWLIVTVTLGLAYVGVRALFSPAAPVASPTNSVPAAAVPNQNATSILTAPVVNTRSRAERSPVPVARVPEPPAHTSLLPTDPQPSAGASVQVAIEHQFDEAQISVWVDERLAYRDSLRGGKKRRLLVLRNVRGNQSRSVYLAPGEHRLRVRVQSTKTGYDQEASILGTFAKDVERILQVKCNRKDLQLKLVSPAVAP